MSNDKISLGHPSTIFWGRKKFWEKQGESAPYRMRGSLRALLSIYRQYLDKDPLDSCPFIHVHIGSFGLVSTVWVLKSMYKRMWPFAIRKNSSDFKRRKRKLLKIRRNNTAQVNQKTIKSGWRENQHRSQFHDSTVFPFSPPECIFANSLFIFSNCKLDLKLMGIRRANLQM